MRSALYFLCGFFILLPIFVFAQVGVSGIPDAVSIQISPETVSAGGTADAFLESTNINLNSSRATWSLDGVVIQKASAKEKIQFTAPQQNASVLSVEVQTGDGKILSAKRVIISQSIGLLWQTTGFTPPFYKGKSALAFEGGVMFTPVGTLRDATGKKIPPEELVYTWKSNGRILGSLSGLGKNTLTMESNFLAKDLDVSVSIASREGIALAEGQTNVSPRQIDPVIYIDDPLRGLRLERAGNQGLIFTDPETHLFVIPFFGTAQKMGDSQIRSVWAINGERADTSGPWDIRVRQNGEQGLSSVTTAVQNPATDLQSAAIETKVFLTGNQ